MYQTKQLLHGIMSFFFLLNNDLVALHLKNFSKKKFCYKLKPKPTAMIIFQDSK